MKSYYLTDLKHVYSILDFCRVQSIPFSWYVDGRYTVLLTVYGPSNAITMIESEFPRIVK